MFEAAVASMRNEVREEYRQGLHDGEGLEDRDEPIDHTSPVPPPAQATETAPDQRAQERRARLEAAKARNRERVDAQQRRSGYDKVAAELERERQERAALEARARSMVDPTALDEAKFLELAEKSKVSPEKLAEFLRMRLEHPERFAAEFAQRAIDPKLSEQEQKLQALQARIDAFEQAQQQQAQAAEQARQTHAFLESVAGSDSLASQYLKAEGADQFLRIAERAATMLPDHATQSDLFDQIEELLETDGRAVYQQLHAIYGPRGPSNGTHTPPNQAPAKPLTTVTNQIAQERSSVVTEGEFWRLPFEERLAAAKRMT